MTINAMNPTLWAKDFQSNLNKVHVFADESVTNRKYEGTLKASGEAVKIISIGRITTKAYTRNAGAGNTAASPTFAGIDRPEVLAASALWLTPDQQYYFSFEMDDVDKAQQMASPMSEAMREAAYSVSDRIDFFVSSTIQTGVAGTVDGTGNRLAAKNIGISSGDDGAYETLVDLGVKLDEADVTSEGRWAAVPPWFHGMLLKDVRFTNYGTSANRETLKNGSVGEAAGFLIKKSNNLSGATPGTLAVAAGVYTVLAGTPDACTFGEQLDTIEPFRPQDGFNDAVKGLHVYGAKVTRPYALASVACTAV
jgi:hypothetical protein